jgi:hypothetical protein
VSVLPQHGFLGSLVAVGSADEGLVPFAGVDAGGGETADLAGSASRRETTLDERDQAVLGAGQELLVPGAEL